MSTVSVAHLFKEPVCSHVNDWILSKQYNTGQIQSKIQAATGSSELSGFLTDAMMSGTGADYEAIMEVCRRFSLTSGWVTPASGSWVYIFHSTKDDSVPYANYTAMKNYLDTVDPSLSSNSIEWESGNYGGHVDACIQFILQILDKYWDK